MKARDLFDAMELADAEQIAAALGEAAEPAEAVPAEKPVPVKPDKSMSPGWRWMLTAGCAAACIGSAVMLIHLIPKNDYTYMQQSVAENEITRELNQPQTTTAPQQTDATAEAVQTQTDHTQTDPPQTKPSDSAAASLTETQTTAKQNEITHTTRETTASTTQTTKQTTKETTASSPEPEKPVIQSVSPEQLIQELKTGIAPGFCWGDDIEHHSFCEIWYQFCGVAFLCDDIDTLKQNGIGTFPVNFSDGAWVRNGGNGYCRRLSGSVRDGCLVQPVTGFTKCYGDYDAYIEDGGGLFDEGFGTQLVYTRVTEDYAKAAELTGKTVYMVSAGNGCGFEDGDESDYLPKTQAAYDNTHHSWAGSYFAANEELICALAKTPGVTLLGLVNGEICGYGGIPDYDPLNRMVIQFRADADPDLNDYVWLNAYLCKDNPRFASDVRQLVPETMDDKGTKRLYLNPDWERLYDETAFTAPEGASDIELANLKYHAYVKSVKAIFDRLNAMPDVELAYPQLTFYC